MSEINFQEQLQKELNKKRKGLEILRVEEDDEVSYSIYANLNDNTRTCIKECINEYGVAENEINNDNFIIEYIGVFDEILDRWCIDLNDLEELCDNYCGYTDKIEDMIIAIYDDFYDLAYDIVTDCCNVDDCIKDYIDFERFGEDVFESGGYYSLKDGRIVRLDY